MKRIISLYVAVVCGFVGLYADDTNSGKAFALIEQDKYADAVPFLERAALEKNDVRCIDMLASIYLYGLEVEQNLDLAKSWATKGCELSSPTSTAFLGFCNVFERPDDVDYLLQKAIPLLIKAYNLEEDRASNPDLYMNTANLITLTYLAAGSASQSTYWLNRMLDDFHDNARALGCAAYAYWSLEDNDNAVKYASDAESLGDLWGKYVLGMCQINGDGISKNEKDGFNRIRKVVLLEALDGGEPEFTLAECYCNGIGTDKNISEALRLYKVSADKGYEKAIDKLKTLNQ